MMRGGGKLRVCGTETGVRFDPPPTDQIRRALHTYVLNFLFTVLFQKYLAFRKSGK